jgi:CRISPR/Cas system CSM-associated protein Csm3 (group 7 of RAMP superfamily)
VPVVLPTRSWCFRTLDVEISFGEYKPTPNEAAWGLDMLAVGPHDTDRTAQPAGDGQWAKPAWATNTQTPDILRTDRALLMDAGRPLLPGASVRGPLRHAFSRLERAAGHAVKDPHLVQGDVGADDPAGRVFGTVRQSSRILIRDARARSGWAAAKLHMHAEDEFSAGSFGSAKRDAVRLLRGTFPVRIVVEGATSEVVEPLVKLIDRQVALGSLGHMLIGGHKTRGAGAGRWQANPWLIDDVKKVRDGTLQLEPVAPTASSSRSRPGFIDRPADTEVCLKITNGTLPDDLAIGLTAKIAKTALGGKLVAWWCDPTIDLELHIPPVTFGREWPAEDDQLRVDEIAFCAERAVWRAVRTSSGARFVLIEEIESADENAANVSNARVVHTPARLHGFLQRFSAADTGQGSVLLREWHIRDEVLGFTITQEVH